MADTSLIFNIVAKDKTGAGFDKVKAGAAAAGVAIGAALMGAVNVAIEKSKLDNKVAAQLGATPAQAKEIGKLSGSVYAAGFGEDMPSVTAAIKAGAQNGLVEMDNISSDASKVAISNLLTVGSVLEEDSERVSSAVSQMLRTGLADSSQEAMDILVAATQKGVNKSQDLLDTVNEYGTQFRKLGLDGTQAMGLMSQAIQAGARDSDTAADALKEFSIRAIDGSSATTKAFDALGLNAGDMAAALAKGGPEASAALQMVLTKLREMKDPVAQNAAAVGLFGTKAEDLGQALFAMDLDTATTQMGNIKGATQQAADTAASGAAGWGALGRQFQMALVDTLNLALPAVNAVFGFMQRNSSWVQPLAIGIGAIAVAMGIATAVQWAYNAAVAANPITWIILAIVALIAVIVIIATKTRFFQNTWRAVWGFMRGVGHWFAGPFAGFFTRSYSKIGSSLTRAKNQFLGFINMIRSAPGRMAGALGRMFSPLWNGFRNNVNRLIGGWNRLSFGIPGFSFAGLSVPGISIGTPDIPYLATGGDIRREGILFAHAGERVVKKAEVTRTGPGTGSGGGGGGGTLTIKGDGSKTSRFLLEILREAIRDKGGDPVKVLESR